MNDRELKLTSGWGPLAGVLLGLVLIIVLLASAINSESGTIALVTVLLMLVWVFSLFGFVVNAPNHVRVITLLGQYAGTVKEVGFFYGNPLYWRKKVSLRIRTFETGMSATTEVRDGDGRIIQAASQHRQPLKVNDKDGTPIEISAVIVWRVRDAAQAVFQVDKYLNFVQTQADAALRNLTSRYRYDAPDADQHSLRAHIEEVAAQLKVDLTERYQQAGVEVLEARISYLAYAPEIAAAMLQRQQAGAIIAARKLIVEAAVGMVEHALQMLAEKNVIELDPERKAAMVSNLLVVLCGHVVPQPVLNAGTLHN
jgi:regulator of protease activity HflC (stomatin/prohibitin superfamily)